MNIINNKYNDLSNYSEEFINAKPYPHLILDVNLEDLTENSEKVSKKIFNFCELTWTENVLNYYKRKDLYSKTLSFNQIRSKVLKYDDKKYQSYFNILNDYKDKYQWLGLDK